MNSFPNKVWTWERTDSEGRPLWFSTPETRDDFWRRKDMLDQFEERMLAKIPKEPDRVLRRGG